MENKAATAEAATTAEEDEMAAEVVKVAAGVAVSKTKVARIPNSV